ncbi:Prefoldin [Cryphonectria parasitica EP155]|uniref:Prefoldin n=1 Tax=Cryphonectria parasitica (strain ATCC 38755 / EP155) TaxID=660469 RepID=A0A9P5CN89_CRYP1|nr:Prefoldin [Cryphonectria parasitica EP155]KAF3764913.1 Prefoldin [Cryphonectria parasitica EP155]
MSLSQEALQKLYGEIQTQALRTQQELALGRSQMASKQREMRLTQLTLSEISSLSPETPVYEGVGKMFVSAPVPDMKSKLQSQMKQLEADVESLNKKIHYLDTTAKNSQDHIEAILKRGSTGGS